MSGGTKKLEKNVLELERLLAESEAETRYFRDIAEASGKRRLREINQLSWLIEDRKQVEEALRQSEEKLRSIIEHSNEVFYIHDAHHNLTYASPQSIEIFGYTPEEMMRQWTILTTENPINQQGFELTERAIKTGEKQRPYLLEARKKDGSLVLVEIDESPIKDASENVVGITGAVRDVTEQKKAEEMLRQAHDELEKKVKSRTRDLDIINTKLKKEIDEHKRTEKALRNTEKDLKDQASYLENVNTALKVLIEHREQEKRMLEENIMANVKKLVLPYVEQLETQSTLSQVKSYVNIIRTNLENLISPFTSSLSSEHLSLTPTEIKVADLVRQGLTNKEIASHLNVSTDAVSFHRKNIRKKLGLTNRKTNLRSYLQRLSK